MLYFWYVPNFYAYMFSANMFEILLSDGVHIQFLVYHNFSTMQVKML